MSQPVYVALYVNLLEKEIFLHPGKVVIFCFYLGPYWEAFEVAHTLL